MKLEISQKYKTKNGCELRIYTLDGEEIYPIEGTISEVKDDQKWSDSIDVKLNLRGY